MNKQLLERIDNLLVNLLNEGRDVKNLRNQVWEELQKDYTSVLADNKLGARLKREYLKNKDFEKSPYLGEGSDEYSIWSFNGFDVYEEKNWSEDNNKYPYKYYFATVVRGNGEIKSSYSIKTETQLENIYYSLTNKKL